MRRDRLPGTSSLHRHLAKDPAVRAIQDVGEVGSGCGNAVISQANEGVLGVIISIQQTGHRVTISTVSHGKLMEVLGEFS